MANEPDEHLKRWTAKRRAGLVIEILRGDTSVAEAARKHGLTVADIEDWRERFAQGAPAIGAHLSLNTGYDRRT